MSEACVHGVAVVVVREGRFLMIRRAPRVRCGGAWCFVGGAMEPGETQVQAVEREFREEVGGRVRAVQKLWEFRSADGRLYLHWWLAELVDDSLRPNPAEVSDLGWLTIEQIRGLSNVLESNLRFLADVGHRLGQVAPGAPGTGPGDGPGLTPTQTSPPSGTTPREATRDPPSPGPAG